MRSHHHGPWKLLWRTVVMAHTRGVSYNPSSILETGPSDAPLTSRVFIYASPLTPFDPQGVRYAQSVDYDHRLQGQLRSSYSVALQMLPGWAVGPTERSESNRPNVSYVRSLVVTARVYVLLRIGQSVAFMCV